MSAKKIIKILALLIIFGLITTICLLAISYNNAKNQDIPIIKVTPILEQPIQEQKTSPATPVTRDENNLPKSDYKVPEIG